MAIAAGFIYVLHLSHNHWIARFDAGCLSGPCNNFHVLCCRLQVRWETGELEPSMGGSVSYHISMSAHGLVGRSFFKKIGHLIWIYFTV